MTEATVTRKLPRAVTSIRGVFVSMAEYTSDRRNPHKCHCLALLCHCCDPFGLDSHPMAYTHRHRERTREPFEKVSNALVHSLIFKFNAIGNPAVKALISCHPMGTKNRDAHSRCFLKSELPDHRPPLALALPRTGRASTARPGRSHSKASHPRQSRSCRTIQRNRILFPHRRTACGRILDTHVYRVHTLPHSQSCPFLDRPGSPRNS